MTLGQIAYEAYCGSLDSVGHSWSRLPPASQLAWQRAAVAVATFRASSVKSSDIFDKWYESQRAARLAVN
jgi:hypothetical protein